MSEQGRNNAPKPQVLEKFLTSQNRNIIPHLDDTVVARIGKSANTEYQEDLNDPNYQKKRKNWEDGQKLVKQEIEEKSFPFDGAANVKYPLLTNAAVEFASRAYPEIVQGHNVAKPKIYGSLEMATNPAMPAEMQQTQMAQAMGQMQEEQRGKIERAEDVCAFVNWQLFNEIHEWEEDMDRMMAMLALYGSMFKTIYYSAEKKRICTEICTPENLVMPYFAPSLRDTPRISKRFYLYPRQIMERIRSGRYTEFDFFQDEETEAPEEFIEQIRWEDLDGDGFKEPYLVTIHLDTNKAVRISPNFTMEGIKVNDQGQVSRIEQVQYFVKYSFIPSTDGSIYDLGFFDLLYPINEVINSTTNRLLDAGTLQNTGGGFISAGLGFKKKGAMAMGLGEYITVPATGLDIRQNIYSMDWPGPSPVLFNLLSFMVDAGRDIANLKEVLEGDMPRNQPATTTMALIEQGMKVFTGIYKRIHRSLADELQLIRYWNYELRNPLYGEVLDKRLTQDDFADDDLDFIPVSDPTVVTDIQRMGKANFLMQWVQDPALNTMEVRRLVFENANMGDVWDVVKGKDPMMQQLEMQNQQLMQGIQQLQQALGDQNWERQLELIKQGDEAALNGARAVLAEAQAIKALAEAEAAEAGAQLDQYQAEVTKLGTGRTRSVDDSSGDGMGQGAGTGTTG